LAITRMIFDGFFDRHPNLKIIASHGGGTLPYLVGRFEKGDEVEIPSRRRMQRKPTDYLVHIYYDSITYNFGALQYLISVVGADHVMFGTDWPHQVHDTKGAFANTAKLPQQQCDAIRRLNARRGFKLERISRNSCGHRSGEILDRRRVAVPAVGNIERRKPHLDDAQ